MSTVPGRRLPSNANGLQADIVRLLEDDFTEHYVDEDLQNELDALASPGDSQQEATDCPNSSSTSDMTATATTTMSSVSVDGARPAAVAGTDTATDANITVLHWPVAARCERRRISALARLNMFRCIGQLIALVESLHVEAECCDFFDAKLAASNLHTRTADSMEDVSMATPKPDAKQRFALLIADIERLLFVAPPVVDAMRSALHRFRAMREELQAHNMQMRSQCRALYEKICYCENSDESRSLLCTKLEQFCAIRENIYRLRYDLKHNQLTDDTYAALLINIKKMATKMLRFDTHSISTTSAAQLLKYCEIINVELAILLNHLMLLKMKLDVKDQQTHDRLFGRQVEITIVKPHADNVTPPVVCDRKVRSPAQPKYRHRMPPIIYTEEEEREVRANCALWYRAIHASDRQPSRQNANRST